MRRILLAFALLAASVSAAPVVEFSFPAPPAPGNPFARQISAEIGLPSGAKLVLPAFYDGDGVWRVRARAAEAGRYRVYRVMEAGEGGTRPFAAKITPDFVDEETAADSRGFIRIDPDDPHRFAFEDGEPYYPFGFNLAWGDDAFYPEAFRRFRSAGLNWTRIWMAHWADMNLDWPGDRSKSTVKPGGIDLKVARKWDRIVSQAEDNGVYFQLVLQHHGQFSTLVNSNWAESPWNAAKGGILATPQEFFTSPAARELTRLKYRYIVARWGYSSAILSWELFNEVQWVDTLKIDHNPAPVAAWHREMAGYIRSVDVYRHLITTSYNDSNTTGLESPIYDAMDYYEPHLYRPDMFGELRHFSPSPDKLTKPVFYGEFGADNMLIPFEEKRSQQLTPPLIWLGLMSDSGLPAQAWEWNEIFRHRFGDVASAAAFIRLAGLPRETDLRSADFKVENHAPTFLQAVGRRSPSMIVAWIYQPEALRNPATGPVAVRLHLGPTPSGMWRGIWWDTHAGKPQSEFTLAHPGGELVLETPYITRDIALLLRRIADAPPAPAKVNLPAQPGLGGPAIPLAPLKPAPL
jgi:hypothetical protein